MKKVMFCEHCQDLRPVVVWEDWTKVTREDWDYAPYLAYGPQSRVSYSYRCSICGGPIATCSKEDYEEFRRENG